MIPRKLLILFREQRYLEVAKPQSRQVVRVVDRESDPLLRKNEAQGISEAKR